MQGGAQAVQALPDDAIDRRLDRLRLRAQRGRGGRGGRRPAGASGGVGGRARASVRREAARSRHACMREAEGRGERNGAGGASCCRAVGPSQLPPSCAGPLLPGPSACPTAHRASRRWQPCAEQAAAGPVVTPAAAARLIMGGDGGGGAARPPQRLSAPRMPDSAGPAGADGGAGARPERRRACCRLPGGAAGCRRGPWRRPAGGSPSGRGDRCVRRAMGASPRPRPPAHRLHGPSALDTHPGAPLGHGRGRLSVRLKQGLLPAPPRPGAQVCATPPPLPAVAGRRLADQQPVSAPSRGAGLGDKQSACVAPLVLRSTAGHR